MSVVWAAEDSAAVLRWLLALGFAGWLIRPAVARALPGLADHGWLAAKALAWLIGGYAAWLAAALGLVGFAEGGPLVAALVLGAIGWAARRDGPGAPAPGLWRWEAGFLALFALGLAQRLAQPDLTGLEKFTNLAFVSAAMRAETMPPEDAWFAGHGINYYYFGQAATALWAGLTQVTADRATQLQMATLFALGGGLVGLLSYELIRARGRAVAGVVAALATAVFVMGGNLHSLLYTVFRPWMPTTRPDFYFPDSTRFIGYDPPTGDKGFTEFPAYALYVGDMHAHVLATPGFLVALVVLLVVLRQAWRGIAPGWGAAGLLGGLMGLAYMTNAWDVAVIGLLALIVWAGAAWRLGRAAGDRLAAVALAVPLIALAVAAPFAAAFEPFSDGLAAAGARTPFWQLLVVHGATLPGLLALAWLLVRAGRQASAELVAAAMLGALALILIALPEYVRLVDIYAADHARANTMFKLTFRAHTAALIAAVAAVGWLATGGARRPNGGSGGHGANGANGALVAALVVALPIVGTLSYVAETFPRTAPKGLDGLRFLGAERPLAEALDALPLAPGEAIIEANGAAFSGAARMSTVTGKPTVLGWDGHQWLWRGSAAVIAPRVADVRRFYETADPAARCRIMLRYGLRYAVLGTEERRAFPDLDAEGIAAAGAVLAESPAGRIVRLNRERCRR